MELDRYESHKDALARARNSKRQKVNRMFCRLLDELLSMNSKDVEIMDLSNILNARKNILDKLK